MLSFLLIDTSSDLFLEGICPRRHNTVLGSKVLPLVQIIMFRNAPPNDFHCSAQRREPQQYKHTCLRTGLNLCYRRPLLTTRSCLALSDQYSSLGYATTWMVDGVMQCKYISGLLPQISIILA